MIVTRRLARETRSATRGAFTLMEVLVVVAILVILASVGSVAVFHYLDTAKEKAAKAAIHTIETAVVSYKLDHGNFPAQLADLTVVQQGKTSAPLSAQDILDPWDNQYQYEPSQLSPTGKPHIFTVTPGGEQISNF